MANNDEYLAIREGEAVLAARIARLEDILLRTTEIDPSGVDDSVTIGSVVTVVDAETGKLPRGRRRQLRLDDIRPES